MRKIIGFALIALGIFLEFLWLGICFGSVTFNLCPTDTIFSF